jgi:DNA polymerase-3 subunit alpha
VFQLFGDGRTNGVFQFESSGMKTLLRKFKPERFEDLIMLNALYRPGPMQMLEDCIARKHGKVRINFLLPELEPILKETYGIMVYQEQVMQIASKIGGFSLGKVASPGDGKKLGHQAGMKVFKGSQEASRTQGQKFLI